uniref:RNA helicase n=1 Tax=Ananas comosus var. bracteatus TaxID=296719 RepID=A0A6V7PV58_ANACO|nr:unnamed protein product [Ananas comosus var. bracteatus]
MPSVPNNVSTQNQQSGGGRKAQDDRRNQQSSAWRQWILQQRKSLPVASVEKRIVEEVKKNDTLIVVGETGSGKTTQLPQFLYNAGFCHDGRVIGITQPRRVAAVTVAKRVAEECNVELGQKVGYSIRFEDVTSSSTRIKYMTDGLLLREALLDAYLSRYSIIIVDEAHERTVHTDVLLGLLKNVQLARSNSIVKQHNCGDVDNDTQNHNQTSTLRACQALKCTPLKLIIMSASLDARGFLEYFGGAKAVYVQGRQYPVEILYTYQPEKDYPDATLITIFQIHIEEGPGDILAFLTGQEEIESMDRLIHERVRQLPEGSNKLITAPIHSSLPSEQQMNVFKPAPSGFRKVILATNIAETSVTIPAIKYVIDPGWVKVRSYNPVTGMESLTISEISKAQALQRSGRAGREGPGKCFRLYTESAFSELKDSTVPEIKRTAIVKSLEQLLLQGALTDDCKLSDPVGHQMARLPLDPMYSKALIVASEFKCLEEMLIAVSMLSVESIFYSPRDKMEEANAAKKRFSSPEGDHIALVNVYRASAECLEKRNNAKMKEKAVEKALNKWCRENFINYRALRHARDVHRACRAYGPCSVIMWGRHASIPQMLTASFFLNVARREPDRSYRTTASGQSVHIHPSSVLSEIKPKPDCIIFNELVYTTQNYVRNVTRIDPLWLPELAPQYYAAES